MAGRYGGYNNYGRGNFNRRFFDSGAGCMFCTGVSEFDESHTRRQCPVFRSLKSNISDEPYVEVDLKERDKDGFAAAGFMLWKRIDGDIEFLMAREYRDEDDLLNFLGGKRLRKSETPVEVALRMVDIESGGRLLGSTLQAMGKPPLVHWSGKDSKYALFLFEVTEPNDCEIDMLSSTIDSEGVKRLEWVFQSNLFSAPYIKKDVHGFALDMVRSLTSCNVLQCITELFNTAKAASHQNSTRSAALKEADANVEFDFGDMKSKSTGNDKTDDEVIEAVRAKLREIKLKSSPVLKE